MQYLPFLSPLHVLISKCTNVLCHYVYLFIMCYFFSFFCLTLMNWNHFKTHAQLYFSHKNNKYHLRNIHTYLYRNCYQLFLYYLNVTTYKIYDVYNHVLQVKLNALLYPNIFKIRRH